MAGVSLQCGDCGTLFKSVEEAEKHAERSLHTNFCESTEPVLNLACSTCRKPCRSKTASDLHTLRTGHTEFVDKTEEEANERIRIAKELLEAKRIEEENERKRIMALRKAEKEEEKRAREKVRQKLEEDKAERRRKLGLPPEDPATVKTPQPVVEEKKSSLSIRPVSKAEQISKAEQMRDCLRSLKQSNKDDDDKIKTTFITLSTFVRNVATKPDEEKFRKIRLSNVVFQERVGKLGGEKFLELCGFEIIEGGEFLFLPRDKVDMAVLLSAGNELDNAINNPYFGII